MKKIFITICIILILSINAYADYFDIGDVIGEINYSDIKTFVKNKEVESFNINGKTAIYVEDLKEILNVSYDDKKRIVNINDKKLLEVNDIGPFQHLKFDAPIYEYNITNQNEFNIKGSIIDEKIDESFKLKIEYKNERNQFDLIEEKTVNYDGMTFDYNISIGNKKGVYKITVVVPLTAVNNQFTDIAAFYIEYK
ncbi:MAG: hypothetical protein N4A54_02705 [Peptostreptococcaceae bacterium]|jgi:hypothetical protein|nr:hypothetical protein [Peptostreptococcaceae bacterium]